LAEGRPYPTETALYAHADRIWSGLPQKDWLEAFHHHPPIGGKQAGAKQSSAASLWSAKEQSTAQKAAPEVLSALAAANRAYAEKFGFVFLICATGKTSEEILQSIVQRTPNDPETEIRIAAQEQQKIMRLRLEKLLSS
jgi:OHCU decarboxylase